MSRHFITLLNEWKRKRPAKAWAAVQNFEKGICSLSKPTPTSVLREVERCTRQATPAPVNAVEADWEPEVANRASEAMSRCQVVAFEGDEAVCTVFLDGFELPRVGFPAWAIRQKKLDVGGRFIWIMRNGSRIRPADIDPDIPQADNLTAQERAEVDRLYEKFQHRRAEDGGDWPEYNGSGR